MCQYSVDVVKELGSLYKQFDHLSTPRYRILQCVILILSSAEGDIWGVEPPPPKFRSFDDAEPNSQFRGKHIRNDLIRIRVSLIF